jgi:hypothetical protein
MKTVKRPTRRHAQEEMEFKNSVFLPTALAIVIVTIIVSVVYMIATAPLN